MQVVFNSVNMLFEGARLVPFRARVELVFGLMDISVGLQNRECFTLLGSNGAGKSNMFKCLTGTGGGVGEVGLEVTWLEPRVGGHVLGATCWGSRL